MLLSLKYSLKCACHSIFTSPMNSSCCLVKVIMTCLLSITGISNLIKEMIETFCLSANTAFDLMTLSTLNSGYILPDKSGCMMMLSSSFSFSFSSCAIWSASSTISAIDNWIGGGITTLSFLGILGKLKLLSARGASFIP